MILRRASRHRQCWRLYACSSVCAAFVPLAFLPLAFVPLAFVPLFRSFQCLCRFCAAGFCAAFVPLAFVAFMPLALAKRTASEPMASMSQALLALTFASRQ